MITAPGQLFLSVLLGLIALAVLAGGLYLLYALNKSRPVVVRAAVPVSDADPRIGTAVAYTEWVSAVPRGPGRSILTGVAVVMLLFVFAGKYLVSAFFPSGQARAGHPAWTSSTVHGASGAELAVSSSGPADGPILLFTHGWGADRRDWEYAISALPPGFHVVAWDLPGLGASTQPRGGEYSMQSMAGDLDSVVSSLGGRPVTLVGHSIGGMLNLEYAKHYPEKMGREVRGLVQANTTFTNPVETKKGAERSRVLQKPVYEPLLHVIPWVSPVLQTLGWFGYQSGLEHLQLASQSFAGAETWDELDDIAKYSYQSSPGVIAKGVLAMLHWDATDVLPRINVPTLIISGAQDVTTLPAASDRMNHDIPSSARLNVSPAAHMGPVEQHQRYAEAISTFVTATK